MDKHLLWIAEPSTTAAQSVVADRRWLDAWPQPDAATVGVLRVYAFAGDVVALGRYHRAPPSVATAPGAWHRRLSGGRVAPFGDGFVGVSLILPQRGALAGAGAETLRAEQALNRYVRGLLEGCRGVGLPVIYPGRDFVTIGGRPFALISMEESRKGAVLVEMILAVCRSFALLPQLLDRLDPSGVVPMEMVDDDRVTTLSQELHTPLAFDEVATLVRRGFEQQFGVACVASTTPVAKYSGPHPDDEAWLTTRVPHPELDHHAIARTQLGCFEVYAALGHDHHISDIQLAGDFLANSGVIERLEDALRGCPANPEAIGSVVAATVQAPADFLLGVGPPRAITDLILRAVQIP